MNRCRRRRAVTPVPGWVLLEHPGPWGFAANDDPRLVGAVPRAAARAHDFRINLIRAYDRPRRTPSDRAGRCLVASAHGGGFLRPVDDVDVPGRLDAVLETAGRGGAPAIPPARQIFLVCTNGRRNTDCARRGRPVAAALLRRAAGRAWETTHLGGCADAVNLVVLPSGLHYRAVTPDDVALIVAATDRGRIMLSRYRGCSAQPVDVQVAEMAVRTATGLDRLDAVRPVAVGVRAADGGRWVDFVTAAGLCRVALRPAEDDWRQYDVVAIEESGAPAPTGFLAR